MTKTELMKVHTAEQLAEMVVKYQDVSQVKNDEIHELKRQISNLNESNGRLQTEIDIYNNRLLTRATKEAKQAIDNNSFAKVMIVTYEEWENKKKLGGLDAAFLEEIEKIEEYRDARAEDFAVCGANLLAGEIKGLDYALKNIKKIWFEVEDFEDFEDLKELNSKQQKEIERLQSEVEKYRKSFEDAKNERDCKIAEYQKKIEELAAENDRLKGNVGCMNYREKQEKTNNFYGIYAYSAKNLTKDDVLLFLGILTKELVENGINFNYDMENGMKVYDMTIEGRKTLTDFLSTEPTKIADMLINAEGEYKHSPIERVFLKEDKDTYRIFDIGELRQIAEHLLIYCDANKEQEHNK